MNVFVIGLGVIGLPTAHLLSLNGADVTGFDTDIDKVTDLQEGKYKGCPEIDLSKGRVNYTHMYSGKLEDVVLHSKIQPDYIVVCIGVDVQYTKPVFKPMYELIGQIGKVLSLCGKKVGVSIETTLPPKSTVKFAGMLETLSGLKCGEDFYVAHAPERVTIGRLIENITELPRVVGGVTKECSVYMAGLYNLICKQVDCVDATTAEMVKLTENTYRDVNIAFANEVQSICDLWEVDFQEVRKHVNSLKSDGGDEYTNPVRNLHQSGSGVGGYCLPKDPWLLIHEPPEDTGKPPLPSIIKRARKLNDRMPNYIVSKTIQKLGKKSKGPYKILILGVASIRGTADCRNSPVNVIVHQLFSLMSPIIDTVDAYDPIVPGYSEVKAINPDNYDVVILGCPHNEFFDMYPEDRMKELYSEKVVTVNAAWEILED